MVNSLAPFLDPIEVQRACDAAGLDDAAAQAFLAFAARVRTTPGLKQHAVAVHHCLFNSTVACDTLVATAETAFADEASLLRSLMVLDSIRLIRLKQGIRGVPTEITRDIIESQPAPALRTYLAEHGRVGAEAWIWGWYRTLGSSDLYRLGRLEFISEPWEYPFRVFVNDATGETIALLDAGQPFSEDGYMLGSTTWTTTLDEDEAAIIGHPISPAGFACRQRVCLLRAAWHQALGIGDVVLDMHIPGGTPLTLLSVREALEQALPFFDHFYPTPPVRAFVCDSWLFSNQLVEMLPSESNILRWQQEGYLFPNAVGQDDFLNFIFHTSTIDLDTAPRDTRLRRAVIAHLEQGGSLRGSGYFLLRTDVSRVGSQLYRQSTEQAIAQLTE